MTIQSNIEEKLKIALEPVHLEVINESFMHNVPKGSESHFKVIVASKKFEEMPLLKQHREIYNVLADELKSQVHALSIKTMTASKWESGDYKSTQSPKCLGGSKKD